MASRGEDETRALSVPASSSATQTITPNTAGTAEAVASFQGFLSFIIGISIFGASIFTVIISEIANPGDLSEAPRFTRETVRTFLGISWLLFVLALGVVALSMSLLAYQQEHKNTGINGPWRYRWERLGLLASALIQLLVIAAFLFLSLVLVAYTEVVGWVAVAFTSIAAACAFVSLVFQWV
jgi:hypothetical protein